MTGGLCVLFSPGAGALVRLPLAYFFAPLPPWPRPPLVESFFSSHEEFPSWQSLIRPHGRACSRPALLLFSSRPGNAVLSALSADCPAILVALLHYSERTAVGAKTRSFSPLDYFADWNLFKGSSYSGAGPSFLSPQKHSILRDRLSLSVSP